MTAKPADLLGSSTPLVQPLYQSSVFTLSDLDALDSILDGKEPGFIYARDGHPNARLLAGHLARLEGAGWSAICGSGMAATTAAILPLVKTGDRILASDRLYGRTTQLMNQELSRFGVGTTFIDTTDISKFQTHFDKAVRLLFVETISNPLLRMADIDALAELADSHDCKLVVDNTFATPILARPLEHGADIVIESLTKMIAGHSDVTLGVVAGKGPLPAQVSSTISIWGLASNPFDCWLACRGLETLELRMRAASANAAELADWLASQPGVARVIYPGRTDHPDHQLARRLLKDGFGSMLCFELQGGRNAVNRFMRLAPGIPFSPSLGHTTTTCSHPATTSHRYLKREERQSQGISDGLIRLSVGAENVEETKKEMERGLK